MFNTGTFQYQGLKSIFFSDLESKFRFNEIESKM